jgi:hypothetical protein
MAGSVAAPRLAGLVVLDLALAVILALAVGVLVALYFAGPAAFAETWIDGFDESARRASAVVDRVRQVLSLAGVWEGMIALPLAILFTSALPTLLHLGVALAFLSSKLFRPLLQPMLARLLYLFHASPRGVLTQVAVGGGVLVKAGHETVKYFAA